MDRIYIETARLPAISRRAQIVYAASRCSNACGCICKAEHLRKIAARVGCSVSTVRRTEAAYYRDGIAALIPARIAA